jgi:tetrahydromethanopterin S-methyltransferase subunit G
MKKNEKLPCVDDGFCWDGKQPKGEFDVAMESSFEFGKQSQQKKINILYSIIIGLCLIILLLII